MCECLCLFLFWYMSHVSHSHWLHLAFFSLVVASPWRPSCSTVKMGPSASGVISGWRSAWIDPPEQKMGTLWPSTSMWTTWSFTLALIFFFGCSKPMLSPSVWVSSNSLANASCLLAFKEANCVLSVRLAFFWVLPHHIQFGWSCNSLAWSSNSLSLHAVPPTLVGSWPFWIAGKPGNIACWLSPWLGACGTSRKRHCWLSLEHEKHTVLYGWPSTYVKKALGAENIAHPM